MNNNLPAIEVSSKLAYFQPGMYIVRMTEDAPGNVVMLSSSPVGRGTVDFFPGDGVLRNTLTKLGDCVVLRVKSALGSLLITEFHKDGLQHKTTLKIDKIGNGGELQDVDGHAGEVAKASPVATPFAAMPTMAQAVPRAVAPTTAAATMPSVAATTSPVIVRKMGHVEAVGDVVNQAGWLGDPTSAARLEGFAISPVGLPGGVQLSYGVLVAGTQRYAAAVAGQFVGTRQKAKALVGVMFELTGPNAQQFRLSGQVVFAGHPPLAIEPGVPMSGPSGTEHLVALQLSIVPNATQFTAASAWDDPKVTRIARTTPAAAQKAAVKKAPAKKAPAKTAPVKTAPVKRAPVKTVPVKKAVAAKGTTNRSKK